MVLHVRGVLLPDEAERDAWVRDGRLTFERPPAGVEVEVVAEGGWVLPGLVDAHCHIGISPDGTFVPDLEGQVAQAVLTRDTGALLLRDAGSPMDTRPLQQRDDVPRLIRAGRHIAPASRYIRGQGVDADGDTLVAVVEAQARAGDGWVKVVGDWIDRDRGDLAATFPEDALAAAVARAHELGCRVAVHTFSEEALPGIIAAGVDSIEHGTGLTDDLVDALAATGAAVVPTLINTDTFPSIAERGARFPVYAAHMRALHATARTRLLHAWEAGVPVYVGTDGGAIAHGQVVAEVTALAEAGIPLPDVIAAASWAGRRWLGHEGLVEGAPADLVVYDEDPRRSLQTLHQPRRIVLGGRVVR